MRPLSQDRNIIWWSVGQNGPDVDDSGRTGDRSEGSAPCRRSPGSVRHSSAAARCWRTARPVYGGGSRQSTARHRRSHQLKRAVQTRLVGPLRRLRTTSRCHDTRRRATLVGPTAPFIRAARSPTNAAAPRCPSCSSTPAPATCTPVTRPRRGACPTCLELPLRDSRHCRAQP